MQATVTFGGTDLALLTDMMKDRVDKEVRTCARKIEIAAKQNAPVDTGALKSSIYVVDSKHTDYEANISDAKSKMAKKAKGGRVIPRSGRMRVGEAWVIVGVEYGLAVELYHQGRAPRVLMVRGMDGKMRRKLDKQGNPEIRKGTGPQNRYMQKALNSVKADFQQRCREALRK